MRTPRPQSARRRSLASDAAASSGAAPLAAAPRFDPNFAQLGEVMVRDLALYEAVSQSEGGDAR